MATAEFQSYTTIFTGYLHQDSFLSTVQETELTNRFFAKNGQGQYVLLAQSLRGALLSMMKRVFKHALPTYNAEQEKRLMQIIQGQANQTDHQIKTSCLILSPSTVVTLPGTRPSYLRSHNQLHAETLTTADQHGLHQTETLPPGTLWPFCLQVSREADGELLKDTDYRDIVTLVQATLAQWQAGRCLLGAERSRGMGRMTLQSLKQYSLTTKHLNLWPDSALENHLPAKLAEHFKDVPSFEPKAAATLPKGWREWQVTAKAAPSAEHGFSPLFMAGNAQDLQFFRVDSLIGSGSDGPNSELMKTQYKQQPPDAVPVYYDALLNSHQSQLPYAPGSSIKGRCRSLLRSRIDEKVLIAMFGREVSSGNTTEFGQLKFSDLLADPDQPISWVCRHSHAQDGLVGGIYKSAYFQRLLVCDATFTGKLWAIDATEDAILGLEYLLALLALPGVAAMGGHTNDGFGLLEWSFKEIKGQVQETAA